MTVTMITALTTSIMAIAGAFGAAIALVIHAKSDSAHK